MLKVLFALLPAIAAYVLYFGPAILVSLTLATASAARAVALRSKRGTQAAARTTRLNPSCSMAVPVVTAWLLALSMHAARTLVAGRDRHGLRHQLLPSTSMAASATTPSTRPWSAMPY